MWEGIKACSCLFVREDLDGCVFLSKKIIQMMLCLVEEQNGSAHSGPTSVASQLLQGLT